MKCISAAELHSKQRLTRVYKDVHAKRDVAYLVEDRQREWVILCQSLPLLARWINENVSSGCTWERVSVTGLFENIDRTDGRHGGWHKGRYRVRRVPLAQSSAEFEAMRKECTHAVVVAGRLGGYQTSASSGGNSSLA